jgi:hypothetical protein
MRAAIVTLLTSALISCTSMTDQGAKVRVVGPSEVQGYQFVGQVTGSAPFGGLVRTATYESAMNQLLNNAAALGATRVVLTQGERGPRFWTFEQNIRADAYRAPDTAH